MAAYPYPAAESYLNLIYNEDVVKRAIKQLQAAKITKFKAKDILRASGLSPLGIDNLHVEKDKKKIREGKSLSPVILVRDTNNGKLIIADGMHRTCAVYHLDEDAIIPCKIV